MRLSFVALLAGALMAGLILGLASSQPTHAGPYYNPPEESSEETKATLREVESLFNDARRSVIDMLDNWEHEPALAEDNKLKAVGALNAAIGALSSFDLPTEEDFTLDYNTLRVDKAGSLVIASFRRSLEQRGISLPKTYSQLLDVSSQILTAYVTALESASPADGGNEFADIWLGSRGVVSSDSFAAFMGAAISLLANSRGS